MPLIKLTQVTKGGEKLSNDLLNTVRKIWGSLPEVPENTYYEKTKNGFKTVWHK